MTPAAWILVALLAAEARPNPYLSQARVFYQGLDYEKCLQRTKKAVRWKNDNSQAAEVALYQSLCEFHLGKESDAAEHLLTALRLNPDLALPLPVSPKFADLYRRQREVVVPPEPKIASRPAVDAPPAHALEPSPTALPPPPPAWAAKRKSKNVVAPLVLGSVAVASGAATLFFGLSARRFETSANTAFYAVDAERYAARAQQDALFTNIGIGVASAAAAAALLTYFLTPAPPPVLTEEAP